MICRNFSLTFLFASLLFSAMNPIFAASKLDNDDWDYCLSEDDDNLLPQLQQLTLSAHLPYIREAIKTITDDSGLTTTEAFEALNEAANACENLANGDQDMADLKGRSAEIQTMQSQLIKQVFNADKLFAFLSKSDGSHVSIHRVAINQVVEWDQDTDNYITQARDACAALAHTSVTVDIELQHCAPFYRHLQHILVEQLGFSSHSIGQGVNRHLVVTRF